MSRISIYLFKTPTSDITACTNTLLQLKTSFNSKPNPFLNRTSLQWLTYSTKLLKFQPVKSMKST